MSKSNREKQKQLDFQSLKEADFATLGRKEYHKRCSNISAWVEHVGLTTDEYKVRTR